MVRALNPFGIALESLRDGLRNGVHARGDPLIVVDLSRKLKLSPTPVREALSRLAGEGLIIDRRGRGYFAPRQDIHELVDLYQLHLTYVECAFRLRRDDTAANRASNIWGKTALKAMLASTKDRDAALRDYVESFYAEIVAGAGNEVLASAHRVLADRLAFARRAEARVIPDLKTELERLAELLNQSTIDDLETEIRAYHARRLKFASRIVGTLR